MHYRTLAFIGAGNMTRAIISGLVKEGYPADKIVASNPSRPKLDALQSDFGIRVTQDNLDACEQAEAVVLAVKPQMMEAVGKQLQQCELADKLFISIAAGLTVARLQEMLGEPVTLVRTMPNTPSALGLGMTGLYAESSVAADDKGFSEYVMEKVGKTLWVDEESGIDGVIAAAGSSPAYFFLFLEAMQKEAQSQGFTAEQARTMVSQAMLGAAEMVCHNPDLEISQLRAQVTSKGGTTAQAIAYFEQQQLDDIVSGAMKAAVARAKEMSESL